MATVPTKVDDIDGGSDEVDTVYFLDPTTGKGREIDLSAENRQDIEEFWQPFVKNSRPQSATKATRKASSGSRPRRSSEMTAIRAFGRENGFEVKDRGRPSSELRKAWEAAGSPAA